MNRKKESSMTTPIHTKSFQRLSFFLKEDVSYDRTSNYWVPRLICLTEVK